VYRRSAQFPGYPTLGEYPHPPRVYPLLEGYPTLGEYPHPPRVYPLSKGVPILLDGFDLNTSASHHFACCYLNITPENGDYARKKAWIIKKNR
jgi:hypothetical protein